MRFLLFLLMVCTSTNVIAKPKDIDLVVLIEALSPSGASVEVQGKDGGNWTAKIGDVVQIGDTLRLSKKTYLKLRLSDGSVISLWNSSIFKVEKIEKLSKTNWLFTLLRGGMTALVRDTKISGNAKLRVNTPMASLGVRGTKFSFGFSDDPTKDAILLTNSGSVFFAKPGVDINSGAATVVSNGMISFLNQTIHRPSTPIAFTQAKRDKLFLKKFSDFFAQEDFHSKQSLELKEYFRFRGEAFRQNLLKKIRESNEARDKSLAGQIKKLKKDKNDRIDQLIKNQSVVQKTKDLPTGADLDWTTLFLIIVFVGGFIGLLVWSNRKK